MLSDTEFLKSFELLRSASKLGIKVTLQNDRLIVKAPKHASANTAVLSAIRLNQQIIVEFLSSTEGRAVPGHAAEEQLSKFENGQVNLCGHVTPVQLYWLDSRIDTEYKRLSASHGSIITILKLEGFIDETVLQQSVMYLLERHESLRTIFLRQQEDYMMQLLPARLDLFYKSYACEEQAPGETSYLDIVEFNGHHFDTSAGPLFIIRFVRVGSGVQMLAVKIHHVIADTASLNILRRDLLVAYQSFSAQKEPVLPALHGQYGDHLKRQNVLAQLKWQADKEFWESLYERLPVRLYLPAKNLKERLLQQVVFQICSPVADGLKRLAGKYKTTLFIVVQAAFKYFLGKEMGVFDILIGTYVSGRDKAEYSQQIGCYAKTMLIRSVFSSLQVFEEVVEIVKKANRDMYEHQAYTLRNRLEHLQPAGHNTGSAFWDINLQFSNQPGSDFFTTQSPPPDAGSSFRTTIIEKRVNEVPVIPIILQLNFSVIDKKMYLKTEYDTSVFNPQTISSFLGKFQAYMEKIVAENDPGLLPGSN